jgi:phosphoesterase RecJ-like protein
VSGSSTESLPYRTVADALMAAPRVVLVTHEYPDGDAVGATLALQHVLVRLGKSVVAVCRDRVPAPFQFLPGVDTITHRLVFRATDLVVTLDCGDARRTGFPSELRSIGGPRGRVINIDHHQKNDLHRIARVNLVNYEASSASEVVYELIRSLGASIDKLVATALLTGIYNDTGGFRHANTTEYVLTVAADLLRAGGRLRDITRNIAHFRSMSALRLWGIALERIRYHELLGIVASAVTQRDLESCQALQEDLAGAVNLINHVPEARVAILCTETADGQIKASLRTERNDIDVARLATYYGGGGLKKAAGFSIPGCVEVADDGSWQIRSQPELLNFSEGSPFEQAVAEAIRVA